MKKRLFLLVLVAAVVACLFAPTAALAKSKITPNIRGIKPYYTLTVASPTVTLSGRLLYRKWTVKSGKKVKVDAPIPGHINLYRRDDNTYKWLRVSTSQLVNGAFSFEASRGGFYRVRYVGAKGINARQVFTTVESDFISINNLHAVSASILPTSGDVFVRVGADVDAPAGVITSSTPAFLLMYFNDQQDDSMDFFRGPFTGLLEQIISHSGTYQAGFTVPAADTDKVITLTSTVYPLTQWMSAHSVTATFTPSDLLP